MNCPYCNCFNEVLTGVCKNCGRNLAANGSGQPIQTVFNSYNNQNSSQAGNAYNNHKPPQTVFNQGAAINNQQLDTSGNDDLLLEAFIGKKYDKLTNGKFSWCCFFFGPFYAFYRKMWLLGIIWIIIGAVLEKLLGKYQIICGIIFIITSIFISRIFKERYLDKALKQIKKIREKNVNSSFEELSKICKRKGGVSIVVILLLLLIIGLLVLNIYLGVVKTRDKARERYNQMIQERNYYPHDVVEN